MVFRGPRVLGSGFYNMPIKRTNISMYTSLGFMAKFRFTFKLPEFHFSNEKFLNLYTNIFIRTFQKETREHRFHN